MKKRQSFEESELQYSFWPKRIRHSKCVRPEGGKEIEKPTQQADILGRV